MTPIAYSGPSTPCPPSRKSGGTKRQADTPLRMTTDVENAKGAADAAPVRNSGLGNLLHPNRLFLHLVSALLQALFLHDVVPQEQHVHLAAEERAEGIRRRRNDGLALQ